MWDALLVGRNRAVAAQIGLLAAGLAILVGASLYTDLDRLWPLPLVPSGVVAAALLAAACAVYNEGIASAWAVAGAPAAAAVVVRPGLVGVSPIPARVGAALATGVGVALVAGTAGGLLGAGARRWLDGRRGERYVPSAAALPRLFVGRDRRRSIRFALVAVGVFTGIFGFLMAVRTFSLSLPIAGLPALFAVFFLAVAPATVQASLNDGLLVSVLLAVAPLFAVLAAFLIAPAGYPYPPEGLLYGVGVALLYGIPLGVATFLLGVGARRIVAWRLD